MGEEERQGFLARYENQKSEEPNFDNRRVLIKIFSR